MTRVLVVLVVISCLIELTVGGSLIAFALLNKPHPLLPPLLSISETGGHSPFLPYLLALPFLALAVLNLLILRWIRDEKEEAHHVLHLYGATAFIGGILSFLSLGQTTLGWAYLILGGLRGLLLVAVSSVVMLSPSTVSALGLPSGRVRRSSTTRRSAERTGRDSRHRSRPRRSSRDRDEAVATRRERRPRSGERSEGEAGSRSNRSRRSAERDRSSSETRSRSRRPRRRSSRDPGASRDREQQPREREASRARRSRRPRERSAPASEPFKVRPLPDGPARDASAEGDVRDRAAEASAELIEPADFVGSRRRKKGRYSTGALFRPRGRRAHRPLGGDMAKREGDEWTAAEQEADQADGKRKEREHEGNGEERD